MDLNCFFIHIIYSTSYKINYIYNFSIISKQDNLLYLLLHDPKFNTILLEQCKNYID